MPRSMLRFLTGALAALAFAVFSLASLALAPGGAAAAPGPGEVGGPAPDWTLDAYGGGSYTLSDYRDKVVMMFVVGYG